MIQVPEIITLGEACQILKINRGYAYRIYGNWRNYGVRILKTHPNAQPRFYVKDILRMLEAKK